MSELADRIGAKFEWMGRGELEEFQSEGLQRSVTQAAKSPLLLGEVRGHGSRPERAFDLAMT